MQEGGGVSNGNGGLGSGGCSYMPVVEEYDDEEECAGLEPFFFDEAEAVADHERRMRREQEAARKEELRVLAMKAINDVKARILDEDPKQGGKYYNRFCFADFSKFDLDEESPLEPMRNTDRVYKKGNEYSLLPAVNIFSVKIASSDVGFPIHVYGTAIARDNLEEKCVFLFNRDKDHYQLINSEDESLILSGPKRGLVLLDPVYVEIDLKIKDHQGQEEKELSKGFLTIGGVANRVLSNYSKVESRSLATRLSTVEVMYAVVNYAVEATIAIEVLQGEFYGKITACITSIPNNCLVLHDSKVAGMMNGDGKGVIQLLRRVVSVCLAEKLSVTIVAQTGDEGTIDFAPDTNGGGKGEITVGATTMLVKVTWSVNDEV
ncbi:uncharacterized protein LOC133926932 [Phragmites australis]|uniref:uncharacterized protein LOC133926932 n=1 Tax=Phragmites australis TaxID=29695 RepID=UPI002D792914|nr:uncharacterized protein LOC133926932 [Phragmites australis]